MVSPTESYKRSKSWLELHPIVPTMLLVPVVVALVVLSLWFSGSLNHETNARVSAQAASVQVEEQVVKPLCSLVDRYALSSDPAISRKTVDAWYSFGHTVGCPNEKANR